MYVKMNNPKISVLNLWEDTEINRKRIKAWGLVTYEGEVEEVTDFKLKIIKGHANDYWNPELG